jgi:competence protein ComEA
MGRILSLSSGVIGSAWLLTIALAASTPATTARQSSSNTQSQASSLTQSREVFARRCSTCHALEDVTSVPPRTRADWGETIDKMIAMGAEGSDEEFTAVLHYLTAEYGRVNVNKAPADEIAEALNLTAKEAAAIVKYREDKGKFQDFDALSKVPGVDVAKLERKKAAISF